jgi:hypothetical protein
MALLPSVCVVEAAGQYCGPVSAAGSGNAAFTVRVARGKRTYVCVTLGDKVASFDPLADRLSSFEFPGSHDLAKNGESIDPFTFAVSSLAAASDDPALATAGLKKYSWVDEVDGERRYIPSYTAIIQVCECPNTCVF